MINNLKELQNAVNLAMDKLISETSPEQYKQIQSTIVNIKGIMNDAKQGKNVDKEIEKIAKVFNNGRRDT